MAQKKETIATRVARLEELAEILLEEHVKTEESFRRTEEQFREIRRESAEREKRLDERIEKLVIAIGELISRMPPAAMR